MSSLWLVVVVVVVPGLPWTHQGKGNSGDDAFGGLRGFGTTLKIPTSQGFRWDFLYFWSQSQEGGREVMRSEHFFIFFPWFLDVFFTLKGVFCRKFHAQLDCRMKFCEKAYFFQLRVSTSDSCTVVPLYLGYPGNLWKHPPPMPFPKKRVLLNLYFLGGVALWGWCLYIPMRMSLDPNFLSFNMT